MIGLSDLLLTLRPCFSTFQLFGFTSLFGEPPKDVQSLIAVFKVLRLDGISNRTFDAQGDQSRYGQMLHLVLRAATLANVVSRFTRFFRRHTVVSVRLVRWQNVPIVCYADANYRAHHAVLSVSPPVSRWDQCLRNFSRGDGMEPVDGSTSAALQGRPLRRSPASD